MEHFGNAHIEKCVDLGFVGNDCGRFCSGSVCNAGLASHSKVDCLAKPAPEISLAYDDVNLHPWKFVNLVVGSGFLQFFLRLLSLVLGDKELQR